LAQIAEIYYMVKSPIKSHQLKSNPNQITSFQIKSFVLKSNQHM